MQHQPWLVRSKGLNSSTHEDHQWDHLCFVGNFAPKESLFDIFIVKRQVISSFFHKQQKLFFYRIFLQFLRIRLNWLYLQNRKILAYKMDKMQYLLTICVAQHVCGSMPGLCRLGMDFKIWDKSTEMLWDWQFISQDPEVEPMPLRSRTKGRELYFCPSWSKNDNTAYVSFHERSKCMSFPA